MKNMIVCALLLAGTWRGVLLRGGVRTPVDFRFTERGGTFWGRGLMPVPLGNVRAANPVHFEIPGMAVFEGMLRGETLEGTFRDESGSGMFRLEKQLDWDDPRMTP